MQPQSRQATVTATFSRRMELTFDDGKVAIGRVSGRKMRPVCGDRVGVSAIPNEPEWLIDALLPRDNELARPNSRGQFEVLAANLTFLCVIAADPPAPDWFIVDRYLSAAELMRIDAAVELMRIDAAVVFNKTDIAPPKQNSAEALSDYERIGYRTVSCSAKSGDNMIQFENLFAEQTAIIVGQSGVGKSSLINFMVQYPEQRTAEVSTATGEGRHTTVNSVMLSVAAGGRVIDSPGVRDYAPATMTSGDVISGFREIEAAGYDCKFANCRHLREPGCAIKAAVDDNTISARRYESYKRLQSLTERLAAGRKPYG
jgi:ribosome biogenesis GTPase